MLKSNGEGAYVYMIAHKYPKSVAAEAYRTLRTNLGFAGPEQQVRVIMVTSAGPGEGKTTTIGNLGIVLAQAGHRVCLVDCDLRKPCLHRVFELDNARGLTTALAQNLAVDELIRPTGIERLSFLGSGPIPPNPAELLGLEKMKELWSRLLEQYDYVLVDSPPVLAVTDAILLAGQVDGVLLVTRSAAARVELVQDAKARLTKAGARPLGVVLNQVQMTSKDYGYYYYYRSRDKADQIRL